MAHDAPAVTLITLGGTIDKEYPRTQGGYAFEFGEVSAAERIVEKLPAGWLNTQLISVCKKDSNEVTHEDRAVLCHAVRNAAHSRVIVTHGTDTLIESASFVQRNGAAVGKQVIFTGAMRPERFQDSDAAFNLGGAVAASNMLPLGSVAICMGGSIFAAERCRRDPTSGRFCEESISKAEGLRSEAHTSEWGANVKVLCAQQSESKASVQQEGARAPTQALHWGMREGADAMPAAGVCTQSAEYARRYWSAPTSGRPEDLDESSSSIFEHHSMSPPPRNRWLRPPGVAQRGAAGRPSRLDSNRQDLRPASRSAGEVGYSQLTMTG
eukprot:scaffold292847_cov35-Tisochrysis_lutea.AAC.2